MKHRGYLLPLVAALVAGALAWLFAPAWLLTLPRAVCAYDVAALVMLALEWTLSMQRDAEATKKFASIEDPGRTAVTGVVLVSATAGLIAAVAILGLGEHGDGAARTVAFVLAFAAVVLGWMLIHTAFLFRYAHLYYRDADDVKGPDRGLKFPGGDAPTDFDFVYFSFVIGMTFQVSDVQITARRIRRLALGHALISFAYNASIFALTVNVLASLLNKG